MLKELKFVQGAVAKKELLPALTHFRIENGFVRGYNGTIALCAPIPFDIDCNPKAAPMVRAIGHCEDTVQLAMTPKGKLSIRSGKFKAYIECVEGETPHVMPEGEEVEINGEAMLDAFKRLLPFVGDDASRPWSTGVLLLGQSAFATNNVILVECWLGSKFPVVANIPRVAIREMVRIDEPPTYAQMAANSVTFHYSGGRWVRTQLLSTDWPDLYRILNVEANPEPIDERLFEGLAVLKPFTDKLGRVFFTDGKLVTHPESDDGAEYEIPGWNQPGIYNLEMLASLEGVVKQIDFSTYPKPCLFYGERLRGAIIGMRA